VSHTLGAWQGGANLRWSGERSDAYSDPATFSTVKTKLAAYTVLDITAAYRWSPQVRLTARLDNAGDANYQTVYGYTQQPRSLYAGITWTPAR
jgi:vitamin B12 transporter